MGIIAELLAGTALRSFWAAGTMGSPPLADQFTPGVANGMGSREHV